MYGHVKCLCLLATPTIKKKKKRLVFFLPLSKNVIGKKIKLNESL